MRRLLSDAYEERSGRSFDDLLAEVHAYGERTSQVLSWGWTCKPGPAPDHLRQLLYLFVAQALEDSSIKVTEYPNGDAAHILRVVSEAATGHRPSQSGADIRKPLRWMRDYLRLGAGGVTTVR